MNLVEDKECKSEEDFKQNADDDDFVVQNNLITIIPNQCDHSNIESKFNFGNDLNSTREQKQAQSTLPAHHTPKAESENLEEII